MRSIVKRMAEFKRLYELVSFVRDRNNETMKDANLVGQQTHRAIGINYVTEDICFEHLTVKHKVSNALADEVIESALSEEHGYLRAYNVEAGGSRRLGVTPGKGVDFAKKIGPFRIGMWSDFLKHYTSYTLVLSIIAIILSAIAIGVTWISGQAKPPTVDNKTYVQSVTRYIPCTADPSQETTTVSLCPTQATK